MGDESEGLWGIVFTHCRLGIGEGLEVGLALMGAPFHEEADDQPAQHAQDPQSIGAADAATIVGQRLERFGDGPDLVRLVVAAGPGLFSTGASAGLRCSACRLRRACLTRSRTKSRLGWSCRT